MYTDTSKIVKPHYLLLLFHHLIVSLKIQYNAYDPDEKNRSFLEAIPDVDEVFVNKFSIKENSYDCVILCNALHEINPKEWEDTILHAKRLLKNNGYLLIIEDKFLPKGECAHQFGYLILDFQQTKALMGSENSLELKLKDEKYKERISFTAIKKQILKLLLLPLNRH